MMDEVFRIVGGAVCFVAFAAVLGFAWGKLCDYLGID